MDTHVQLAAQPESHHRQACAMIPWHPEHTTLSASRTKSSTHPFQCVTNRAPAQDTPVHLQCMDCKFLHNSSDQDIEHLELQANIQRWQISAKHHFQKRRHIWKSWKHNSFMSSEPAHPVRTEISYSLIMKSVFLTTENKTFWLLLQNFIRRRKEEPSLLFPFTLSC